MRQSADVSLSILFLPFETEGHIEETLEKAHQNDIVSHVLSRLHTWFNI